MQTSVSQHRAVLTISLFMACGALAQQKTATAASSEKATMAGRGTVTGKAFLITGGGDLKPARMANVYLFKKYTVGIAWTLASSNITIESSRELTANTSMSDSARCEKELRGYDQALLKVLNSPDSKASDIVRQNADEDGLFKISARPGEHVLLVRGRAGFNEALWQQDVVVRSGKETAVKLSSPEHACVVIPR